MKNRTSVRWWANYVVHNCVAHPLLVVGEAIDTVNFKLISTRPRQFMKVSNVLRRVTEACDALHDMTVPEGDDRNVVFQGHRFDGTQIH